MDRDTLRAVVDDLEIEDVDRRNVKGMRAVLSRSLLAESEVLLLYPKEKQIKAVCVKMGENPNGRRKEQTDLPDDRKGSPMTPCFTNFDTVWAFEAFRPPDALYMSSTRNFVGEETLKF